MLSNIITTVHLESRKKLKSVCVITNGCTEGRMDSALVEQFFQEKTDFELCHDCIKADLIVFVGCCATEDKENCSRMIIDTLRLQKRPTAQVLVTGCIAKVRPELVCHDGELQDIFDHINHLLRLEDKQNLAVHYPHGELWELCPDLLGQDIGKGMISNYYNQALTGILPKSSLRINAAIIKLFARYRRLIDKEMLLSKKTFCIKVSTGCMGKCAYCGIKLARGRIKSKPLDAVIEEFEQGISQGYEDFALLGTDIGDYGKDLDMDLLDLLEKLVAYKEKYILRLRNVNPRWLIPSVKPFCELLKTGKIGYVLSPVESGSNRILERMNRGYRVEDYIEAAKQIRRAFPPIFLKTQIIVGFAGETEEDFNKSRDIFNLGLFDFVDVVAYSKRRGTKGWSLPDEVPNEIISKRYKEILFRSFFQLPLRRCLSICMLKRR